MINRSLNSRRYRFVLSMALLRRGPEREKGGGEVERCLVCPEQRHIIRCLSAGPAADGPGAQAHRGQGGAGEDGAGQGEQHTHLFPLNELST